MKTFQILFQKKKMCKGSVSGDLFSIINIMFEWALFVRKLYAIHYLLNAISTYVSELAESILFLFL